MSSEHNHHEKRQYGRIKRRFIVRFRIKQDEVQSWDMVTVQDLSAGGILFNYDHEIGPGTFIDIRINFPPLLKPLACAAKVIRVEKALLPPMVRIAASFVNINEEQKELIEKMAREFYLIKQRRAEY